MAKRKGANIPTQKRESAMSARKVQATEREVAIMQLRIGGARYEQIAERLGIVPSTVGRALARTMRRWQDQSTELAGEMVWLQLERLDRLLITLWPDAIEGKLKAIALVLKIEERRAKLMGLDLAQDLNIEHSGELDITFKVVYGDPDNPSRAPSKKPPLLPAPDKK